MRWALLASLLAGLVIWGALARVVERVPAVARASAHLSAVQAALQKQDWETARQSVERLSHAWGKAVRVLSLFIPHSELNQFEVQLAQLEAAVQRRDLTEALLTARAALALWHRMVSW